MLALGFNFAIFVHYFLDAAGTCYENICFQKKTLKPILHSILILILNLFSFFNFSQNM